MHSICAGGWPGSIFLHVSLQVSSSFGETFLEAGNTLGEALLNSKTLTEAHKALTNDTFSFPPTKVHTLHPKIWGILY